MTAQTEVPAAGVEGVIIAQGGAFAGWSLHVKDGRRATATTCSGFGGSSSKPEQIPPGTHQVRMELGYDGGGLAKGGTAGLFLDGTKVGEGRVEATVPMRHPRSAATTWPGPACSPVR